MRDRGFQIGNQALRAAAEESVKDHRRNADRETAGGVDQRLADAF